MSPRRAVRLAFAVVSSVALAACRPPPPNEEEVAAVESYAREAREGVRALVVAAPHVPRAEPLGRRLTPAERDRGIDKLVEGREAMRAKRWSAAIAAFADMGDAATDSPSQRAKAVAAFANADAHPKTLSRPRPNVSADGGPTGKAEGFALLARSSAEASPPDLPAAKRAFELALAQRFDPTTAARLTALSKANLPPTPAPETPCTEGFPTVELLCRCLRSAATPTDCGNSPPTFCNYEGNQTEGGALFAIRVGRDDRAEDGIAHFVASHDQGVFRAVRYLGKESRGMFGESTSDIELTRLEERKLGDRSVWLVHWSERFASHWLVEREHETNESITFCFPPTAGAPARCPVQLVVGSTLSREAVAFDDPPLDSARAARLAKVLGPAGPKSAKVSFEIREDGVHTTLQEGSLGDFPQGTVGRHPWTR